MPLSDKIARKMLSKKEISSLCKKDIKFNKILNKGLLRKQKKNQCVDEHTEVLIEASKYKNLKVQPIFKPGFVVPARRITTKKLSDILDRESVQITGNNIAHKDSKYIGHHSVVAVSKKNKDDVYIVDRDDTIVDSTHVYEAKIKDLAEDLVYDVKHESIRPSHMVVKKKRKWCTIM